MKFSRHILPATCLLSAILVSCSDNEEAGIPSARIDVDKTVLEINESVMIDFIGAADQVVVYPGDEGHDYELRKESNTGMVVNKNHFSYAYSVPGVYKAVCVASSYGDLGVGLRQDTCSVWVNVIDNHAEILRLSCPQVLYDEVFASQLSDTEWLMRLPRKVVYNGKQVAQTLSQRLKFYMGSELAEVEVNGTAFSNSAKYDLSKTLEIDVKAYSGAERRYTLSTLQYPEFKAISINGAVGVIERDAYDYQKFTCIFEVTPEFNNDDAVMEFEMMGESESVSLDGRRIASGDGHLRLRDGDTLTLTGCLPQRDDVSAVSFVTLRFISK